MGFEFFNRAPKQAKSPEQEKLDKQQRNAGIALAAATVAAGGAAYEIHKQNEGLGDQFVPAGAEAEVPAENPTIGMRSTDAPKPITVQMPQEKPVVVNLGEKQVVIDLAEKSHVVKMPEV